MNASAAPTILMVPGLRDHVPEHWQTLLEQKLPNSVSVPRMERDKLSCAAWVAELDRTLAAIEGPVVLVAHSGGVMITVHWAQRHGRAIHGALLAAPPDFESPLPEGYPTQDVLRANGWLPTPRARLPFPKHRRGQHQRSARQLRARRRTGCRMGQPPRRRGCRRPPQSGGGLWRMAAGSGIHSRACPVRGSSSFRPPRRTGKGRCMPRQRWSAIHDAVAFRRAPRTGATTSTAAGPDC